MLYIREILNSTDAISLSQAESVAAAATAAARNGAPVVLSFQGLEFVYQGFVNRLYDRIVAFNNSCGKQQLALDVEEVAEPLRAGIEKQLEFARWRVENPEEVKLMAAEFDKIIAEEYAD